ncbi:maleylpyruvate isomerase N-terminal domain-containing protein [Rhodocytophaga aerolata]|uniref:Maleylpyruvate isomerase N-terminal domain-containing protein n=1 Tax=Rhodocytophaga aerolata TaxID=455078 RepID=A0ABT8R4P1_9BACT|nr:maleylpyruvate isomerase N-terminal domain-containing protein [Rhodocytophaga aerolata]MDO1445737.1 maleylpyruvate isomerase N-terminal domain-containing protein [Rhodocytophaga aerolata]
MQTLPPIHLIDLFPELDRELIQLLRSLSPDDWNRPTVARLWTVKDIASHLLDGNIRRISMGRDNYFGEKPENIQSYADLVNFLNGLNADWVKATKRISPQLLIELLEHTGKEVYEVFKGLDPYAKALFSVAWAGEAESRNWFDIAREYTERWHHQQQIRLAVHKAGIMNRHFYYPLLDTFMRALPHTYRHTEAEEGAVVKCTVTGEAGGNWFLYMQNNKWQLVQEAVAKPLAEVIIPGEIAWQLFTKAISPAAAREKIVINGPIYLGEPIINMVAVMA